MRIAVPQFPGSNCDQDAIWALRDDLGVEAEYAWHEEFSLDGFDGVFVPGGFTYGDYLRCGAIASRSHIMEAVAKLAAQGKPVIGVCNGFQILCETGLLPGALLPNVGQKFLCQDVWLTAENRDSAWTKQCDRPLRIPIAHGEGRYLADPETLEMLRRENRIAFTYGSPYNGEKREARGEDRNGVTREPGDEFASSLSPLADPNPNGSIERIAGVLNEAGNVLGMMPHPERATKAILGNTDGLAILRGFLEFASKANPRSGSAIAV